MAETFSIASTITARDGNNLNKPFVKSFSLTFVGTLVEYNSGLQVPITPTSITLPVSPANIIYIKNIGTPVITVTWTPNGGSSTVVQTLTPSAFIMVGQGVTGQGITALSVQSTGSLGTIEYVLG